MVVVLTAAVTAAARQGGGVATAVPAAAVVLMRHNNALFPPRCRAALLGAMIQPQPSQQHRHHHHNNTMMTMARRYASSFWTTSSSSSSSAPSARRLDNNNNITKDRYAGLRTTTMAATTTNSSICYSNNVHQQKRHFASSSSSSDKKLDFYEVLGVSKSVDKSELKKAYFKLAKQYHPDTNKGNADAEARFKQVTEAYEVLSDDKKREMYNQYGHAGVDPNFSHGGGPGGFDFGDGSIHFSQGNGEELEDIFEAFFGGGGRRRQRGPRRGADLQMQVEITFEEAVFGVQKDLDIRYQVADAKSNQVKTKERSVKVDIPAGMESGMNLRLKNQGAEGDPGAPNGNLLVQVLVRESDYYAREGADVHTELSISIAQAILGGSLDVKTLTGTVELKIPPGSQPGARLMIRNRGIPRLNSPGSKGNHYVHLKVQIPKTITARQEALLREFDQAGNETLCGRVAHAAESAFQKVFGKVSPTDDNSQSDKKNAGLDNKATTTSIEEEDSADDDEPKKQAAQ